MHEFVVILVTFLPSSLVTQSGSDRAKFCRFPWPFWFPKRRVPGIVDGLQTSR